MGRLFCVDGVGYFERILGTPAERCRSVAFSVLSEGASKNVSLVIQL